MRTSAESSTQGLPIAPAVPSGAILGASMAVENVAQVDERGFDQIIQALGVHGVLRFPRQALTPVQLRSFGARLGDLEINVAASYQVPDLPEVMILSNIVEDGRSIGLADAGQSWHTDMSYSAQVAFANVLYAIEVPQRQGKPLGATEFCDMCAAYDDLDAALKERLRCLSAEHDFDKFWEMMRQRPGSTRPPLTPAQRQAKPPVSHPMVIRHPISGRNALYANPGYTTRVHGLSRTDSDALLAFLFAHQTQEKYRYVFHWEARDLLIWDNLRVIHQAVPDYGPHEHRLMHRCQVMATKFKPLAA